MDLWPFSDGAGDCVDSFLHWHQCGLPCSNRHVFALCGRGRHSVRVLWTKPAYSDSGNLGWASCDPAKQLWLAAVCMGGFLFSVSLVSGRVSLDKDGPVFERFKVRGDIWSLGGRACDYGISSGSDDTVGDLVRRIC